MWWFHRQLLGGLYALRAYFGYCFCCSSIVGSQAFVSEKQAAVKRLAIEVSSSQQAVGPSGRQTVSCWLRSLTLVDTSDWKITSTSICTKAIGESAICFNIYTNICTNVVVVNYIHICKHLHTSSMHCLLLNMRKQVNSKNCCELWCCSARVDVWTVPHTGGIRVCMYFIQFLYFFIIYNFSFCLLLYFLIFFIYFFTFFYFIIIIFFACSILFLSNFNIFYLI